MARSLPSPDPHELGRPAGGWRLRLYQVIFESDTPAGRLFDKAIIAAIIISVAVVMADSVQSWHVRYRVAFDATEWFFTALFTVEYLARLVAVKRPVRYARSFFGIVDLLAVLPTYLALFFPGLHALIHVRVLRLLRVFRIFKLTAYVAEYQVLGEALSASRRKILVFLSVMMPIGWGTLAVPTGIVTAEMTARRHALHLGLRRVCEQCGNPLSRPNKA